MDLTEKLRRLAAPTVSERAPSTLTQRAFDEAVRALFSEQPEAAHLLRAEGPLRELLPELVRRARQPEFTADGGDVKSALNQIERELRAGLGNPRAKRLTLAVGTALRLVHAQAHPKAADASHLRELRDSFSDPRVTPERRLELLSEALGDKSVQMAVGARGAVESVLPQGRFSVFAREAELGEGAQRVGSVVDGKLGMGSGRPEAIRGALQSVHAVFASELSNLSKVCVQLPPEGRAEVKAALGEYGAEMGRVLFNELRSDRPLLQSLKTASSFSVDSELTQGLTEATQNFEARLSRAIDASPESRAALKELAADAGAAARMAFFAGQAVYGLLDTSAPREERILRIRTALEKSGGLPVKIIQKLMTFQMYLEALVDRAAEDAKAKGGGGRFEGADWRLLFEAAKELQDRMTPMPDSARDAEVLRSLGGTVDEKFRPGSFEPQPMGSASIGQTHRAMIDGPRGPERVAVKIRRPGLEELFARDLRVSRIFVDGLESAILGSTGEQGRRIAEPAFTALRGMIGVLVHSFQQESDYRREAEAMKRFRSMLASHPNVIVPRVHEHLSGEGVLTMEYIVGDKLETWLKRLELAKKARGIELNPELLAAMPAEEAAKTRAELFARQRLGLEPTATRVHGGPTMGSHVAEMDFNSETHPRLTVQVGADGSVSTRDRLPELSDASVQKLTETLPSTFGIMSRAKEVHGDYHPGNFKVLPDGKTLALFDFGQTVDMNRKFSAPLRFMTALGRGAVPEMEGNGVLPRLTRAVERKAIPKLASALLDMSDKSKSTTGPERKHLLQRLEAGIRAELDQLEARAQAEGVDGLTQGAEAAAERMGRLSLAGVVAMLREKLFFAPDYFHYLLSAGAMTGNVLSTFQSLDLPALKPAELGEATGHEAEKQRARQIRKFAFGEANRIFKKASVASATDTPLLAPALRAIRERSARAAMTPPPAVRLPIPR